MAGKIRQRIATAFPNLEVVVTDDGSRTLRSVVDDETFHSESGAASESQQVFVNNSLVAQQLMQQRNARVLEIGYGTGLNFLLTANVAIEQHARLDFVAIEAEMLHSSVIAQLEYDQLLKESSLRFYRSWIAWHGNPERDSCVNPHRFQFENISLELHHGNATSFKFKDAGSFESVYLDAFSPQTSPELWNESFLEKLYACLLAEGRLVTYCVKSEIQQRLRRVGFAVTKVRGPADGKREVLVATKTETTLDNRE